MTAGSDKPDRQRADAIFEHALDLEGASRDAYVVEACAGDAALEALVRRLLAATEDDGDFLPTGGGIDAELARNLADSAPSLVGQTVGRYAVVSELGRGGMAIVYLGERQDEGLEQRVAIKVLQSGIPSDEMLQRFQLERQIMARINHPGIAQMIDAGSTDNGLPYLVMEYVDGMPVDRWCDEQQLTIRQRLELFVKIARVVGFAHRNLIVHRDIKPSNIMVTAEGDVKLLDFGIAKLLDDEVGVTRSHLAAMTPAYASPEQIQGEPVSTATDVYQLGMLLYVLLTGRWPYRGDTGNVMGLFKVICETDPLRPSAVLREAHDSCVVPGTHPTDADEFERVRQINVARLRRTLSGDLDTVLGMALRKEPERRYASVEAFATDVERYLAGQTVTARSDSVLYRFQKLVSRNLAASILSVAAVVALVTVTVTYTQRLARERDHAEAQAAKAAEMSDFLTGLFEVSVPTRARGETITARDLLDRGAARIETELADQPELQGMLGTVIGMTYGELAHFAEARDILESAVVTRRQHPGPQQLELAETLHVLGRMYERNHDLENAEASLREALQIRAAALGAKHPTTAESRNWLGVIAFRLERTEEALRLIEQSLADLEAAYGPDHVEVGKSLNHLALVYRGDGNHEKAVEVFERGIVILDAHLDEDHPLRAAIRVNYADALRNSGDVDKARQLLLEAIPRMKKAYGDTHPNVGVVLTNLANLQRSEGEYADAERHQREALEIWSESLGAEHVQIAWCYNNLGLIQRAQGHHEAAIALFHQSIDLVDRTLGPEHVENVTSLNNVAQEYAAIGQLQKAQEFYGRSLAVSEASYSATSWRLSRPLAGLGYAALESGDADAAVDYLQRALEVGRDRESRRVRELYLPRIALARALYHQGNPTQARVHLQELEALNDPAIAEALAAARREVGD